eukprot:SAG22_NODE_4985_length_1115_cov_1.418307_3_plen_34_part_01
MAVHNVAGLDKSVADMEHGSPEHFHTLIEAIRLA